MADPAMNFTMFLPVAPMLDRSVLLNPVS